MATRGLLSLPLSRLRPHPRNASIYGSDPIDDLIGEIDRHGMLEPVVVSPKHVILSGHRRVRAAKALGWNSVPVRLDRGPTTAARLIAFNRQRRKTWTQLCCEALVLLPDAKLRAARRRSGAARGPSIARASGRAMTEVAIQLGLKREALRRLLYIHESHRAGHLPDYLLAHLNSGKWTLHKTYLSARAFAPNPHGTPLDSAGRWRRFLDVWTFRYSVRNAGGPAISPIDERTGAHAPQVFANLVHYFCRQGGTVADPMAGGGAVHDVCAALGRQCTSLDLSPKRAFIRANDARRVPVDLAAARFDLIVLDPPYGNLLQYSRKRADLSNISSTEQFLKVLSECVHSWQAVLARSGFLALFMGNYDHDGICTDLAWRVGRMLEDQLALVRRIWVPYVLTERTGIRVARAAKFNRLATRQCEVFVCQHRNE